MKVKVMSRKEAEAERWPARTYLISIHGTNELQPVFEGYPIVLAMRFDDDDRSFQPQQANGILSFADRAKRNDGSLIVHCSAGISRSAGVAEALHRLDIAEWDERDAKAWMAGAGWMPRYMPNAHVVSTVMQAAAAEGGSHE